MVLSIVEILLLAGLIVFITHALEAVTGFGCSVLAFPFMLFLMNDMEHVKIILTILAWLLAVYFATTKYRDIYWKQFAIIVLLSGAGMPAGMFLFKSLEPSLLVKSLGLFIVVSAAVQLYCSVSRVKTIPYFCATLSRGIGYLILFSGGIVHGAFAVGGPLIILYSTKKIPDKARFRATMCLLWTTLNTVLITHYFFQGKITVRIGYDLLFLLPFLTGGVIVGEIIHKRVSENLFKKIVFTSLLLVGMVMIF
ncbi:hypothetical protein AGMMS50239_37220 [Bacteroidia bacterium]|nr:hypothetical protein AGMMS50239_37220 [Bacteroidia bacterium]